MIPPDRRFSSHRHGTNDPRFGFIAHTCITRLSGWGVRPTNVLRCRVGPAAVPTSDGLRGFTLTSDKEAPEQPKKGTAAQSKNRDMGSALRSVYQKTVEEAVPDDLLSLLGKLD